MPRTKHNNPAHFEPNAHIFDNDMAQITLSDIEAVKIVIQDNGDIEVYDSNGNGYDNPQLLIGDKTHQYIQVKRNGLYGLVDKTKSMLVVNCIYKEMQFQEVGNKHFIFARQRRSLFGFLPWLPQRDRIKL